MLRNEQYVTIEDAKSSIVQKINMAGLRKFMRRNSRKLKVTEIAYLLVIH